MTELEYELTADDYVAFNLHFAATSPVMRAQRRNYRVFLSLVVPVAVFVIIGLVMGDLLEGTIIALLACPLIWFSTPRLWDKELGRNIERMNRTAGLGVTGPVRVVAGDAGLSDHTAVSQSTFEWSSVDRIEETPDYVFIFVGPTQALIVPRRIGSARFEPFAETVRSRMARPAASG